MDSLPERGWRMSSHGLGLAATGLFVAYVGWEIGNAVMQFEYWNVAVWTLMPGIFIFAAGVSEHYSHRKKNGRANHE